MKAFLLVGFITCCGSGMMTQKPPKQVRFSEKLDDKSYLQLLKESVQSPSEPMVSDACVACFGCVLGTCTVCCTIPQVPLSYNLASNSLFACLLFGYCLHKNPSEFATTQLVNKIGRDICAPFSKEKQE